jgi:enediyne biosynthesis protein E4
MRFGFCFCGFLAFLVGCTKTETPTTTSSPTSAVGTQAAVGPAWFEEITTESGVQALYRNGEEAGHLGILESLGGGIGVIDYDRDGLYDLLIPEGGGYEGKTITGRPTKLFRNLGGLKFEDVTAKVLPQATSIYSHGIAVTDYDQDGYPDFLVTGWSGVLLFHNEADGAGRKFVDRTAGAGLGAFHWAVSAAWGDLDGDGLPDLYVSQYGDWDILKNNPPCTYSKGIPDVCPPHQFKALRHRAFKNLGGGKFADISDAMKLRSDGHGLGVLMADFNGDGKPDVYACNDTDENHFYVNRTAAGKLAFEEKGLISGCARDDRGGKNGSMGIDAADYNHSGKASLFVTNYENELHALYHNDSTPGSEFFRFTTRVAGLSSIGQVWVGWGTGFADFDLDGHEDLHISNGHVIRHPQGKSPRLQSSVLFKNDGQGKFVDLSGQGGAYYQKAHESRGAGFVDLDNDGKPDLVISRVNAPVAVLRTVAPSVGRHWVGLELIGVKNRDLVGTRVVVTAGGVKHTRFVKGGGSFACTNDPRLVIGVGASEKIDSVQVYWSWKDQPTTIPTPALDRYTKIHETPWITYSN